MQQIQQYPYYRSLAGRSWYKILSEKEVVEIQQVGKRFIMHRLIASTYMDHLFIQDLLSMDNGRYTSILEKDFDEKAALIHIQNQY